MARCIRSPAILATEPRPPPFCKALTEVIVGGRCGHRRARFDDDAGQRRDRGAARRRGMPWPPTHAGALAPGQARPRPPAAVTVYRHLSNISVTVGPLGPSHRPRTTRLLPLLAARSTPCGDGAGPGLNVARDVLMCRLVAFCVVAWARPGRQRLRSRHMPVAAQWPRPFLGSPSRGAPQKSGVTPELCKLESVRYEELRASAGRVAFP
jgi:hypothetical protein